VDNRILVFGSLAFDVIMEYEGYLADNVAVDAGTKKFQLACMPARKAMRLGGTAGNIAYNASLLGGRCAIITSVGDDFRALGYEATLLGYGGVEVLVDCVDGEYTPSCYIVNDQGNNQFIAFNAGAMGHNPAIDVGAKGVTRDNTQIAILATEAPPAMENYATQLEALGIPFICDPGQTTPIQSEAILRQVLPKAAMLMGNEFEISMIEERLGTDVAGLLELVPVVIRTEGADGVTLFQRSGATHVPSARACQVADTTGAGDGFRGGFLAALQRGLPLEAACRVGVVAASFVVETHGGQTHRFLPPEFEARFQATFNEPLGW
jgi:adenosine kinase